MKPYYQDKWVTIYHGDCREILPTLEKVDLVLTDPPYFIPAKHYETRRLFRRTFGDLGILESFFKGLFDDLDKVLKQDGLLYMFCDGQSYPLFYYYAYFITKAVRPLIWDKKVSFNGYYWRHQHEIILFGVRPEKHKIPTGDGDILRYSAVKVDKRMHPAEKPIDLLSHIIRATASEDATILDPFLGSGTTAYCAKKLGRKCIGIEISEDYCRIAAQRCAQAVLPLEVEQVKQGQGVSKPTMFSGMTLTTKGNKIRGKMSINQVSEETDRE